MYVTVRGLPGREARPPGGRSAVPRTVVLLGSVSLLTDLSSEMVVAVLPLFLTAGLGLSPLQFGVVDGLYRGVTATVRILAGFVADLTRRPKAVAVAGYGLSCLTKLFLLPANGFAAVSAVLVVDRVGKGVRTAPRDAMIAAAAAPQALGHAFGVHRAMDAVGALGGPLIAFGVLAALPAGFDVIFVLSFGLALLGVAVLVLFVPEQAGRPVVPAARPGLRARLRETGADLAGLVRGRDYRRVLLAAGVLAAATVSDSFVYLVLRDRVGVSSALFPLLFVGTGVGYLLLAAPAGRLADRIGPGPVLLAGYAAAVAAYLAAAHLPAGPGAVVVTLLLLGTYYAGTDGVLAALASAVLPAAGRAAGLAGVATVVAVAGTAAAVGFGACWTGFGARPATTLFAGLLVVAVAVAGLLLRGVGPGRRTAAPDAAPGGAAS